jgi:hypothetical protein
VSWWGGIGCPTNSQLTLTPDQQWILWKHPQGNQMIQFLVESPIWLKILLGLLSLPLVCLLMGILVCLFDPSSVSESDFTLRGFMTLGSMTIGILASLAITTVGIGWLLMSWFQNDSVLLSVPLAFIIVFGAVLGIAARKNR